MDELDRNIITLLKTDARMSLSTLARRLKIARSTLQARIERLETGGIIAGYTITLGKGADPNPLRASLLISIDPRAQGTVLQKLKSIPEIEKVHTTSGRIDLLVQLACPDTQSLDHVLDQIDATPGIRSSESLIHLSTRLDRVQ